MIDELFIKRQTSKANKQTNKQKNKIILSISYMMEENLFVNAE